MDWNLVQDLLAALLCGAFIGVERELGKRDEEKPEAAPGDAPNLAGVRTHMLVALLGSVARRLDGSGGPPLYSLLGLAGITLFTVTIYAVRSLRTGQYGTTSVPTLFLTYCLGALCASGERQLALALAVVVTAILAVKVKLHSFVHALSREELTAALKFGLLALVLLPLLPNKNFGPSDAPWLRDSLHALGVRDETLAQLSLLNPYKLWLVVVMISGLGFVGYVLVRLLGPQRGFVLTGLAGGLVSSTSVTLAMAEQSKRTPQWSDPIRGAVLAACTVMAARVLAVSVALNGAMLAPLAAPLGAMILVNFLLALLATRRKSSARAEGGVKVATPLAVAPALKLAALIFVVRVLSEVAQRLIGDAGLVLVGALSGIADVDAITIASSQQAASGSVSREIAAVAILTAVVVNTIVKGLWMLLTGDRATGRRTFIALLLTAAAAIAGLGIRWITHSGA